MVARQLGAVARYESEHRSARVRRKLKANAMEGKAHGRPGYGWRRPVPGGPSLIDPDAAEVIRGIAARIVRKDGSLRKIARELNEAHVPTPTGRSWSAVTVRDVVLRPSNVSQRVHQGEIIGKGDWPKILDQETFTNVRAILNDPDRKTTVGSNARHLLSGVARCGICGARMRVALRSYTKSHHRTPVYRCSGRSCVSRNVEMLEQLVTTTVVRRLAQPDADKDLAPHRTPAAVKAVREVESLQARLGTAADDYAAGLIERPQLLRITAQLRPKIEAAQARVRVVDDAPLLAGIAGRPDAAEVWEQLPLTRRRAIVGLLLEVTVNRSRTRGGAARFDPHDVDIVWMKR